MSEEPTTPDLMELMRQAFDAGNRHDLEALMRLVLADFRPQAEEFRNLDDERVLVLLHAAGGRCKSSGHEVVRLGPVGATSSSSKTAE